MGMKVVQEQLVGKEAEAEVAREYSEAVLVYLVAPLVVLVSVGL